MKLIDNWRMAPKMISVQAFASIAAIQMIQAVTPAERLAAKVPFMEGTTWGSLIVSATIALTAIGAIGRLIDQFGSTTQ